MANKKRWKTVVEFIGGIGMVILGAFLVAEATDLLPFVVHDWVTLILGAFILLNGWLVVGNAWEAL